MIAPQTHSGLGEKVNDFSDPSTLAYRVRQLEIIEEAIRLELHELRTDTKAALRDDYMTTDQLHRTFISRAEIAHEARVKREWLPIAVAIFVGVPSVATFVLTLTAHA